MLYQGENRSFQPQPDPPRRQARAVLVDDEAGDDQLVDRFTVVDDAADDVRRGG
jgi:hypothetical protein